MLRIIAACPSANFSKSEPYVSAYKENRNNLSNLNGGAHFENNEPILCRHLSTQFVYDALADQESTGKVNYSNYHTTDAIRAHVSLDTEKQFDHLIGAGEKSIVSKDTFSVYVEEQFSNMAKDKSHINVFLVVTTDHAMAMILRRKEKQDAQGKKVTVYVVKVYDPNLTDTVARCAKSIDGIDQVEKFEGQLENFLYPVWVNQYFANDPEHIALMVKVTPETFNLSAKKNTCLAQNTQYSFPLSPISMYYLLRFNIAGELLDMRDRISNASPPLEKKFLYDLLMAKSGNGNPGLFPALARGHGEAIKAYAALLTWLPEDQRLDLLMAKDGDGKPGLFEALAKGHGEAKAYAELLPWVPEDQRAELIARADLARLQL